MSKDINIDGQLNFLEMMGAYTDSSGASISVSKPRTEIRGRKGSNTGISVKDGSPMERDGEQLTLALDILTVDGEASSPLESGIVIKELEKIDIAGSRKKSEVFTEILEPAMEKKIVEPIVEEEPTTEEVSLGKEEPTTEEVSIVEEEPTAEEEPIAEETPTAEGASVSDETLVAEAATEENHEPVPEEESEKETNSVTKIELEPETKPQPKTEPQSNSIPESEPQSDPIPESEPQSDSIPESEPLAEPAPVKKKLPKLKNKSGGVVTHFEKCANCWCSDCKHNSQNEGKPREMCGIMMACPACDACLEQGYAEICEIGSAKEGCKTRAIEEGLFIEEGTI